VAIEILKKGRLPEDTVYTGDCYHCGTQMRAKRSDLEFGGDHRDSGYFHECPLCHNQVRFYKEPT